MRKRQLGGLMILLSVLVTAGLTGTAAAWHPQGKIVKTVVDKSAATQQATATTVAPGDTLTYTVTVSNEAAPAANNDNDMAYTVMTDSLPAGVQLVSDPTTKTITENIGTIAPGAKVTKQYDVKVTDTTDGDSITNKACFTGNSTVKDNPQAGCSSVTVTVRVPAKPAYACTLLSVSQGSNRTVTVTGFQQTASNGATFSNVVISWGDASSSLTTNNPVNQSHQYAADGTYTVNAMAHFDVNGKDFAATSAACTQKVSFTTTPSPAPSLPNTGAGSILFPASIMSGVGYAAYLLLAKRRAHRF